MMFSRSSQRSRKARARNRRNLHLLFWGLVACLSVFVQLQGCGCEAPPEPPPPAPEITITPSDWVFSVENPVPGLSEWQTLKIRNSAKKGADPLEVKSITLDTGGSKQFKLIDDTCPKFAPKKEDAKPGDNKYCVDFPSLPIKLAVGEELEFTMQFEHSNATQAQNSKLIVVSNAKNDNLDEEVKTDIKLTALGGAARIDIGGPIPGKDAKAKEFTLPLGKVKKGVEKKETFTISSVGKGTLAFKLKWKTEDKSKSFRVVDDKGEDVMGKEFTLSPPDNKEFTVIYKSTSCGEHDAAISVESNASSYQPDKEFGYTISARVLMVNLRGSSPARAIVDPNSMNFQKGQKGSPEIQTFKLKFDQQSLCDLDVKSINIAPLQAGEPQPKSFKIGKITKGGQTVTLPTTISFEKKEELEIEVIFEPEGETGDNGVVVIDTNDPALDPTKAGVVQLQGSGKFNLPPRPSMKFVCGEAKGACKKEGDTIQGALQLAGERKLKVLLDGSASFDQDGKIATYAWTMESKPAGAGAKIQGADKKIAYVIVDTKGAYKVKLTVTDDKGKSRDTTQTLNVVD